jgi:hypothetical protein
MIRRMLWQGASGARTQILEIDVGARFLKLDAKGHAVVHAHHPS